MNGFILLIFLLVLSLINVPFALKGSKINLAGVGFCLGLAASHFIYLAAK